MKDTGQPTAPATVTAENSLQILRDVANIYETARKARRDAAKNAHREGATFQELGDAMGTDRTSAHALVKGRAA